MSGNDGGVSSMITAIAPNNPDPRTLSYEHANIDVITIRQLSEDIVAYNYDMDFCKQQLAEPNLTPQETRTLQLRTLDLGHQIRHCQHRIEMLRLQMGTSATMNQQLRLGVGARRNPGGSSVPTALPSGIAPKRRRIDDADCLSGSKRAGTQQPSPPHVEEEEDFVNSNTALQRLGFWKCRLCVAPKYLLAGAGRVPASPCKWPLKDVSKMITHFMEMHTEHEPYERCKELGAALDKNRGPFEYWLRKSRSQNIGDGSMVEAAIQDLVEGKLPGLLRRLSRAAASFPLSQ